MLIFRDYHNLEKIMKKLLWLLPVLVLFAGCSKDGGSDSALSRGALYEYLIAPSTTNPAITAYNNVHYVCVDTRVTAKNKLFVFLPGTTGSPEFYKLIVKRAAALGYHAIGLMYPNNSDIYVASGTSTDNTMFGKCRQEIFDGTDQTSAINVNSDNCIKNRLYRLLVYLNNQYPSLNFQQYISGTSPDWSKIRIAGHSQGGGHAFYIAKQVSVDRAISFASIDWNSLLGKSADWVKTTGATPISKFYSINSPLDEIFNYSNVQTQLNDMGITGNPVSIDNSSSPYSNTHRLTTTALPAILILFPYHNVACLDAYVPKDSKGAVRTTFVNAWNYLINY
jgi:hypothetical protein